MEDILNLIINNEYSKMLAWFISVLSGSLALYQYFLIGIKKEEPIKKSDHVEVDIQSRGICSDCQSYISRNSISCIKCGSSSPFNDEKLLKNIEYKLTSFFDIAENFDHGGRAIKHYVLSFLPVGLFFISSIVLANNYKHISSFKDIGPILSIVTFLCIAVVPYFIIKEYTTKFSLSKISIDRLLSFDEYFDDIFRSIENNEEGLNKLETILKKYISIGENARNIRRRYLPYIVIYFLLNSLLLLFLVKAMALTMNEIGYGYAGYPLITTIALACVSFFLFISMYKISYINIHYVNSIGGYVLESHLKHILNKVEKKLGKDYISVINRI